MNVLVIGLNKYLLSKYEFANPVINELESNGYKVFYINFIPFLKLKERTKKRLIKRFDIIVLTGTALKDFYYLYFYRKFHFLRNFKGKILGICAGGQILALLLGIKLARLKNKKIGVFYINNKKRFFLTSFLFKVKEKRAISFRYKNFIAVAYHPEVFGQIKELLD